MVGSAAEHRHRYGGFHDQHRPNLACQGGRAKHQHGGAAVRVHVTSKTSSGRRHDPPIVVRTISRKSKSDRGSLRTSSDVAQIVTVVRNTPQRTEIARRSRGAVQPSLSIVCPVCGGPVPPPIRDPNKHGGGRPRTYCTDAHRRVALLAKRKEQRTNHDR